MLDISAVYRSEDRKNVTALLSKKSMATQQGGSNNRSVFVGRAYTNVHFCGLRLQEGELYVMTLPRLRAFSIASEWANGVVPVDQCNTWRWRDLKADEVELLDGMEKKMMMRNSTSSSSSTSGGGGGGQNNTNEVISG